MSYKDLHGPYTWHATCVLKLCFSLFSWTLDVHCTISTRSHDKTHGHHRMSHTGCCAAHCLQMADRKAANQSAAAQKAADAAVIAEQRLALEATIKAEKGALKATKQKRLQQQKQEVSTIKQPHDAHTCKIPYVC